MCVTILVYEVRKLQAQENKILLKGGTGNAILLPNGDVMVISSETKASDLPTLFSA